MPINYALFENNLTSDPDDFNAVVQITTGIDTDAIIKRVLDQGSTVTEADLRASAADLVKATRSFLLEGARVHFFGLADFFPRVKGKFTGPTDSFDPLRHSVDVAANPGTRVRNEVRAGATVQKVEAVKPAPNPIQFADNGSSTTDDQVTVGNIGTVVGSRLKYDEAQADEGIFFIATAGGETKVANAAVQTNMPATVLFLIPATLIAGTYNLEVRARVSGGTQLRIGRLDATLTV